MLLRRHNLNLLPILRELLRTRSVSETSEIVGLSQPAVSSALAKLREIYSDSLLVMVGRQLELTEKGEQLISQVELACLEIESLLSHSGFDPFTARRRFIVGTADYVAYLLAPVLASILEKEAPGVSVQFVDVTSTARSDLAQGRIDVVIISSDVGVYLEGECNRASLFKDDMVIIASKKHRPFSGKLTREIYEGSRHARFKFYWDGSAHQDIALSASGIDARENILVQQFSLLPSIVEQSQALALIYRALAAVFEKLYDIDVFEPPFPVPVSIITAYWWKSKEKDPAHAWFRDLLQKASAEVVSDVNVSASR